MNTTQPTRSPNEQFNFNLGYRRALRGVKYEPRLGAYKGYAEGWDAGNSDRSVTNGRLFMMSPEADACPPGLVLFSGLFP
jgi:hypothetical protein